MERIYRHNRWSNRLCRIAAHLFGADTSRWPSFLDSLIYDLASALSNWGR